MPTLRKNYVLESAEETERLDRQSRMKAHDFRPELKFLNIKPGQKILDAGCGSGIVTDYLAQQASDIQVTGWDFSLARIESAKQRYSSRSNIEFQQMDLLHLDKEVAKNSRFDLIVCRYVIHHFSQKNAKKVIKNIISLLNPGGTLFSINVEGLFGNIFPSSPFLRKCLEKIQKTKDMDMQSARRISSQLIENGLQDIDWHVITAEFKGQERLQEIENLKQSMKNAAPFLKKLFGSTSTVKRFEKEYVEALSAPGSIHFYNKVVVSGSKPKSGLSLIKG
ncbi:MAG: class I SAM-dependent methyltransferase [Bacteriovoracia bacterium]